MSTTKYVMITEISFDEVYPIWKNYLWPDRISEITAASAMCFLGGYDLTNLDPNPSFFAYIIDGEIAGVNSGHKTMNDSYRSRGLYVFEKFRGKGIGSLLLKATIEQARLENMSMCWSYPKKSSWKSYLNAGFELASGWELSETSDANAYCKIDL